MAYATIDDLEAGWKALDSDERTRATTLLDRASTLLDALVEDATGKTEQLKIVCCNMVQRVMESESAGVSQESMGAGGYSQSWTYANPSGDMYVTKFEKKLLGIGSNYAAGCIKVDIHDSKGASIDW